MTGTIPTPAANDTEFNAVRRNSQLFSDGFGFSSRVFTFYGTSDGGGTTDSGGTISIWPKVGEDDLIMTGVRSFDVKVYDDLYAGYVDLGWKNDLRINADASGVSGNDAEFTMSTTTTANGYNFLTGTPSLAYSPFSGVTDSTGLPVAVATMTTFGHEGRMPPLTTDNRADAQYPSGYYPLYPGYPLAANDLGNLISNIGDNAADVNRLRRVFDTWSTDYTTAPSHAVVPATGQVFGPPFSPPVYPSYPPPYPAPLKAVQIQVRVVDPTNQRIKQITIRHDFSDRL
jgi:hypothetical protein